MAGESIRVTGIVQGVGFRPTVWRLARECGLVGEVRNDAEGVLIHAWGSRESLEELVRRLRDEPPPLSHIEAIARDALETPGELPGEFRIVGSREGEIRTGVAADAATCAACLAEVLDPADRRFRYPFTNCTHCGPRLSIVRAIPYDRSNTSMAAFTMCPQCQAEYDDPADRRFHAQPNACSDCGPRVWLEDAAGKCLTPAGDSDVIQTAARLIRQGSIVAVKGIGGFHLACDAGNAMAVDELRRRKVRYHKALALMARDLDMVRRFAEVDAVEAALLGERAAPVVVLNATGESLAGGIAPAQHTLGFMLPYTPLHHLLMLEMERPIVLTSGNRSDEPQTTDNREAHRRLARIADYYLMHDRDIVNRLDDSVLRVADGRPRFLRRARGYAPQPVLLPQDFAAAGSLLAMGGELKNTFCVFREGKAILSQHIGDLEDAATHRDYQDSLQLYHRLFGHQPSAIVVDKHPGYLSTRLGRDLAVTAGAQLIEVQHHHAHIAACMVEHGLPPDSGRVLGVALDGLGFGEDGTFWGGEFLLADYRGFARVAHFQALPMLGGAQAMREPWRNTFAQLNGTLGWTRVASDYADLEIVRYLNDKPLAILQAMAGKGINSPLTSSCGRLFDAVAAALGVCRDGVSHEGQAAMELESLATAEFQREARRGYPCDLVEAGVRILGWRHLWEALLQDLRQGTQAAVIAARFHQGLVMAVAGLALALCREHDLDTVVLGGGVFQNRLLLEGISARLRSADVHVLAPEGVPANDGGLALGQTAIAAAGLLHTRNGPGLHG